MAHGQWTEVEARGVLEAWKRSGVGLEKFARSRGLVPQRLWWWKAKLGFTMAASPAPALEPVRVTEPRADARLGEPVTVLLRSGHMIKVGRDSDESAFARVVALLEVKSGHFHFTKDFKAEAVRLCRLGDRSIGQIAKDLEPTETALRA